MDIDDRTTRDDAPDSRPNGPDPANLATETGAGSVEREALPETEVEREAPGVEVGDLGKVSDETERTPGVGGR